MLNTQDLSNFLGSETDIALANIKYWNQRATMLLQLNVEFLRLVDRDKAFSDYINESIRGSEEAGRELLRTVFAKDLTTEEVSDEIQG